MREDETSVVRDKALELLSYRDHSEKELFDKLLARKFSRDLCVTVLNELRIAGVVDDSRFAVSMVREKIRSKPAGARNLVSMLRTKGIDHLEAEEVVRKVMDAEGVDERRLAERLLESEMKGKTVDGKTRQRIWNKLIRRGFDISIVNELLDALCDDNDLSADTATAHMQANVEVETEKF